MCYIILLRASESHGTAERSPEQNSFFKSSHTIQTEETWEMLTWQTGTILQNPKQHVNSRLYKCSCSWRVLIGSVWPQVPPQPLWFAPGLANVRKLQELPHHLLHAGLWDELRQEVIGNRIIQLLCRPSLHFTNQNQKKSHHQIINIKTWCWAR